MTKHVLSICLFLLLAPALFAQDGHVFNDDGVLSAAETADLDALLFKIEDDTTCEMAVMVVRSLKGEDLEAVARRVFNAHGIGRRRVNNGVLLLIALEDRQLRLATGYGIESVIDDAEALRIGQAVAAHLKENRIADGVREGIGLVRGMLEQHPWTVSYSSVTQAEADGPGAVGRLVSLEARLRTSEPGRLVLVDRTGRTLEAACTVHMDGLAALYTRDRKAYLLTTGRIRSLAPFVIDLMGVD